MEYIIAIDMEKAVIGLLTTGAVMALLTCLYAESKAMAVFGVVGMASIFVLAWAISYL